MSTFEISIPEEMVTERIDQIVGIKLRHEKINSMLSDIACPMVVTAMEKVKAYLEVKLFNQMSSDLEAQKEMIIESFIESQSTIIHLNNEIIAEIGHNAHKQLPQLIQYLTLFNQAMIVGPTGSGKSTMAKQAADALNLPYGSFSCNLEASKSELIGFQNLNGYVESSFLHFYENGGVFLVDEYDAMSASISVVLNAAFDRSGQISVPNRVGKPVAKKHPNFYCILAGNTWGSGSVEYQGRDMQDAAFLDRFKMCRLFIDYDQQIEKHIAGHHYDWFMKIRKFMSEYVDNEKFSTRSVYDATMLLSNNSSKKDIIESISYHWDETIKEKLESSVL